MSPATRICLCLAGILATGNLYQAGYISAQHQVAENLKTEMHENLGARLAPLKDDVSALRAMQERREREAQQVIDWVGRGLTVPPKAITHPIPPPAADDLARSTAKRSADPIAALITQKTHTSPTR